MRVWVGLGCLIACGLVAACARAPAPLPLRSAPVRHEYLRDAPEGIVGEQRHVRDGVWCSDDDAFSLPVVPFPDGPTRIVDSYQGWGAQVQVNMLDANESLVQVNRTQINPELTEEEALAEVERVARALGDRFSEITSEWLIEGRRKQLQQTNPAAGYMPTDMVFLSHTQGVSNEFHPSCRVDRHFVGAGYWFQVIAVAYRPVPKETACSRASELASWTVEHMKIGGGCGRRQPHSQHAHSALQ